MNCISCQKRLKSFSGKKVTHNPNCYCDECYEKYKFNCAWCDKFEVDCSNFEVDKKKVCISCVDMMHHKYKMEREWQIKSQKILKLLRECGKLTKKKRMST